MAQTLTVGHGSRQEQVTVEPGERVDDVLRRAFEGAVIGPDGLIIVDGKEAQPGDMITDQTRQVELIQEVGELG